MNYLDDTVREGRSLSEVDGAARLKGVSIAAHREPGAKSVSQRSISTRARFRSEKSCRVYVFDLESIKIKHYDAKVNEYVSVNLIVSDGTHPLRFAKDTL